MMQAPSPCSAVQAGGGHGEVHGVPPTRRTDPTQPRRLPSARGSVGGDRWSRAEVALTVEVRDRAHGNRLLKALAARGYRARRA